MFHQARLGGGSLGNLAANPPFIHNPIVYYGFLNSLLVPGASLANRPATVEALERDYTTPSSLNWSVGLRREHRLGHRRSTRRTRATSRTTWRCTTT